MALKEFSFDVKVAMTIHVTATSEEEARIKADELFGNGAIYNIGEDQFLEEPGTVCLSSIVTSYGIWDKEDGE